MANYNVTCRTNYFLVKDLAAFENALSELSGIETVMDEGRIALFDDGGGQGWPSSVYDEDTGEERDIDIADIVQAHLADDEVAVFIDIGSEKRRYLGGTAMALNNQGDTKYLDLNNIYELAKGLGKNMTRAEY